MITEKATGVKLQLRKDAKTGDKIICTLKSQTKKDRHFMDKTAPGKEIPEEVTRESLISISYSVPEKVIASKPSSDEVNGESLVRGGDSDGEDKFRSELISISYTQSPDVGGLPVALGGELKD